MLVDELHAFTGEGCLSYFKRGEDAQTISQTIDTKPSTTYVANFRLKPPSYDRPNEFVFRLNGVPHFPPKYDAEAGYVLHTCLFTTPSSGSAATTNIISFQGWADRGFFYLDDVSVVQLSVPCSTEFYGFDTRTGRLEIGSGERSPLPTELDHPSQSPIITSEGRVYFNYNSDLFSRSFPRRIFALAPPWGLQSFHGVSPECQLTANDEANCPASGDIGFTFRDFEGLFLSECVSSPLKGTFSLPTSRRTHLGAV